MPEGNEVHRFRDRQAATFAGRTAARRLALGTISRCGTSRWTQAPRHHRARQASRLRLRPQSDPPCASGPFRRFHGRRRTATGAEGRITAAHVDPEQEPDRLAGTARTIRLFDLRPEKVGEADGALGPDPLEKGADPKPAFATVAERKTPIGMLLMDQSVFSGIGNIYRAELLYRARLSPFRPGMDVEPKRISAIWRDAVTLMPDGMVDRRIVTTRPKDRPHPRGPAERGEVHYVYRRKGKPCLVCGTAIESRDMAGRTLYWCPVCQKD